jgi:hypothetical protein
MSVFTPDQIEQIRQLSLLPQHELVERLSRLSPSHRLVFERALQEWNAERFNPTTRPVMDGARFDLGSFDPDPEGWKPSSTETDLAAWANRLR